MEHDDEIPLPGQVLHLLIPNERLSYLQSIEFSLGRGETKKRILLAIPREACGLEVMESLEDYLDKVHDIGVIGSLSDPEDLGEEMAMFTIKIEGRAIVTGELNRELNDQEQPRLWTYTQFYTEEFTAEETGIYNDIEALSKVISKNQDIFKANFGAELLEEQSLFRRMDLMADYVFTTREKRLRYLQEQSNLDRWLAITTEISTVITESKNKRQPRAVKEPSRPKETSVKNLSFKERFEITAFPEQHRERILEEINRLDGMPSNSTEASMLKDYLSWVFQVPWGKNTHRDFSLKTLRAELDVTHYGLSDIKDYLIEHMCMEKIKGNSSGAILCLLGPPGTGKSSIARTLARCSGREFQSIALGGVSDESEIRG